MIESQLILDLLELLLSDNSEGEKYYLQIPYLIISKIDYTGNGVFIRFSHVPTIELYRTNEVYTHFNAVTISSSELTADAEAIVHIKEGLLDYLEIWSFDGNYPEKELSSYKAWQAWPGSPGKHVVYP